MRNSTPFLAAFGPLLFGRAPRCRLQDLLGQWPQMPSINQYMEAFGELIPQTLLRRSRDGLNSRQRIFSPLVTFWAFLAQVLKTNVKNNQSNGAHSANGEHAVNRLRERSEIAEFSDSERAV